MQVFLHQHIAAAFELRVFIAHQGKRLGLAPHRVLGAVDETDDAAHIEVAKALDLIDHLHAITQGRHQLGRQLETQVHLFGTDVQQDVTWGRHRLAPLHTELAKRMQGRRARRAEQAVPGIRAKPANASQVARGHALAYRAHQACDVGAPGPHVFNRIGRQGGDHEDRAAGDRVAHRLRFERGTDGAGFHGHSTG